MGKYLVLVCSIALAIFQVGCSGAGSNDTPPGGSSNSCNGAVTELQGGWESCSGTTGDYISYTFTNNCVTVNFKEFSNNDCTGIVTFDESATYPFALGAFVITDGGQTAREINVGANGAVQYDIYMLSSNIMYRGLPTATNNMSSPSTRPTSLNFSISYTAIP
jgi:hypothetical protein